MLKEDTGEELSWVSKLIGTNVYIHILMISSILFWFYKKKDTKRNGLILRVEMFIFDRGIFFFV